MNKRHFGILFFVILWGCSTATIMETERVPTASATAITIQPTNQPTPTVAATATPIASEKVEGIQECMYISAPPKRKQRAGGVLVFQKEFDSPLLFIENLTGDERTVPANSSLDVMNPLVSPDRKWIIYETDNSNGDAKLVLAQADGTIHTEIPYYGDWGWSNMFWLNNHVLRVAEVDNSISFINNFAFDPFTEIKVALRSDFPYKANGSNDWGIDRTAFDIGISRGTNIIYDPTLTKVLYPKGNRSVSLFDIEMDHEIADLDIWGQIKLPKWSPDANHIGLINRIVDSSSGSRQDDFLLLSRDGREVKRLVLRFAASNTVAIETYSWSPNGERIAFLLRTQDQKIANENNPLRLAILDLKTNELIDRCITGLSAIELKGVYYLMDPIWSPDSDQVLISRHSEINSKQTENIIVDLTNKKAYKVTEDMQPVGWMVEVQ